MGDDVTRMDIAKFRSEGYLQELNRCFLHPLGLALEVKVAEDGSESLGGVWDYRNNPEGIYYGEVTDDMRRKRTNIARIMEDRGIERRQHLGYIRQPIALR